MLTLFSSDSVFNFFFLLGDRVDFYVTRVFNSSFMHCTDYSNLSSENMEKSVSPDQEEEPVAIHSSTPDTQNINFNTDSVVSFVASAQTQLNGGKDVSNVSKLSSDYENKSAAYSSMVGFFIVFLSLCVFLVREVVVGFC